MPHDRFFIDAPLKDEVTLEGDEAHHLFVMRKNMGDTVELVNGKNCLAKASLLSLEKKRARLKIETLETCASPSNPIILAQALPKLNKIDFIIEKGTELGATTFWLFPGDKSEKKEVKDPERLRRIAISAMKQCGRLDLPDIVITPPIAKLKELPLAAYFGDANGEPFSKVWTKGTGTLFFIGPESGFSEKEIAHLIKLKAKSVKLHPNILRTETAPLVALSLIMAGR